MGNNLDIFFFLLLIGSYNTNLIFLSVAIRSSEETCSISFVLRHTSHLRVPSSGY